MEPKEAHSLTFLLGFDNFPLNGIYYSYYRISAPHVSYFNDADVVQKKENNEKLKTLTTKSPFIVTLHRVTLHNSKQAIM